MIIGRTGGSLYSTINHPFYDGKKILRVDRLGPDLKPSGGYLFAIDAVGAGAGETVLVIDEGNSARQVTKDSSAPVRSVIIGIIDRVDPIQP